MTEESCFFFENADKTNQLDGCEEVTQTADDESSETERNGGSDN